MYEKIFVGRHVGEISKPPEFDPISKVVILADNENAYLAGDESGRTVEVICPYATQQMADDLLIKLRGYKYRPVTAVDALINPAAEPGDSITIDGVYTILANMDTDYNSLMSSGVSAPGQEEIESEYQFQDKEKQLELKIARTRSLITKTAEQIRLEVANELEGLSSSITVELDSISAQVVGTQNAVSFIELELDSITQRVQNAEGDFTELAVTVDGLTVTDQYGQTKINGSAVYTPNLYVDAANITGTLTAGALKGYYISLLDSDNDEAAMFSLVGSDSYKGGKLDIESGAIGIVAYGGNLYLQGAGSSQVVSKLVLADDAYFEANVCPAIEYTKEFWLGQSYARWAGVYVENGTVTTSDKKRKKNIVYSLDKYDLFFDGLKPSAYQMLNGERTHTGLVAQDVELNLESCGIPTTEFAGFVKAPTKDGTDYTYGLRYEEFVPLLIDQVQKLKARVNILEDKHGSKKTA